MSLTRNCANLLQDNLTINFKGSSFVKPGAQMNEITKTAREELKTLKSDDLVVVWGGANDIKLEQYERICEVGVWVCACKQRINVELINSPHRHDLLPDCIPNSIYGQQINYNYNYSCVNQGVTNFNRQVQHIMKIQSKVKILELNLDRNHFTTHGLHLNSKGKKISFPKFSSGCSTVLQKEAITHNLYSMERVPCLALTQTQSLNSHDEVNKLTLISSPKKLLSEKKSWFFMDMNDKTPQNNNQIKLNNDSFKIYHQNVRRLRRKPQELLCHVYPVLPHVILGAT